MHDNIHYIVKLFDVLKQTLHTYYINVGEVSNVSGQFSLNLTWFDDQVYNRFDLG